jgi:hypothetical protein
MRRASPAGRVFCWFLEWCREGESIRVSVRMLAKTSHRAFVPHLFKKLDLSHQAFGSSDPVYFQRVGSSPDRTFV